MTKKAADGTTLNLMVSESRKRTSFKSDKSPSFRMSSTPTVELFIQAMTHTSRLLTYGTVSRKTWRYASAARVQFSQMLTYPPVV